MNVAVYTQRVQTVLTSEQYEQLLAIAEQMDKPVSVLVREAVEQTYLVAAGKQRRQAALQRLLALDAPIADWEQVESEIEQGILDE